MITNKLGLPQPFVDAATSEHEYVPRRYSVTEVLGGTCEAVLKRRHQGEGDEDVSDRVWAILGTAVHKVLQDAEATSDQLQENWLSVQLGGHLQGYSLSGIFDLYDDSTGTVTDYKTCSVWKTQVGDFEDWRRQTLMYCWMLQQAGFDAWNGEIVAIMRDHNMRKAKTEKEYPKHPVLRIGWAFSDDDMKEVEQYIYRWFEEVAFQEKLGDDELEPCSSDARWHKPDTFAVVKDGNKRAARVLDDLAEAEALRDQLAEKTGKPHHVEHRIGEDTKCDSYCSVAEFCPYVRRMREAAAASDAPTLALAT